MESEVARVAVVDRTQRRRVLLAAKAARVKALGVGEKESLNPRLIKEVLDVCSDRFEEPRLVLKR